MLQQWKSVKSTIVSRPMEKRQRRYGSIIWIWLLDAKYPKETEMYEEYADKALTGFKASIKWLKIVDRAMRMVLPYEAEQVLTQHFVEGKPLKSIRGGRNRYMSRTTATKYKKIGIQKLADNISPVEADLKKLEEILENSL